MQGSHFRPIDPGSHLVILMCIQAGEKWSRMNVVGEPRERIVQVIQVMGSRGEKERKGRTYGGFLSPDFS